MRYVFCTLMFVILLTTIIVAADWHVFHGPNGDNKSPDTELLQKWPDGGPKLLWTADFLGFGYSSVSISNDRIYSSGNVRREGNDLSMVFCLDKEGNKIWERDNGPAHTAAQTYPGTRGTPTVDNDFLYDVSALGEVACFDAKTGDKKWNRNLITDYNAPMPRWFLGHAAVVVGNNLICMVGGAKTLAVALDKHTGKTVWESAPAPGGAPTSYAMPYLFEFEGMRVVTAMCNPIDAEDVVLIEGLDPMTGKTLFSISWKKQDRNVTNCAMPIYRNGCLFLVTGNIHGAKMFKLTKNADGAITATEIWSEKRFDSHHGGFILVGDYVYGTAHNGTWYSINFLTGEIGFQSRAAGKGSVHFADGLIYSLSESDKTVVLLKPEPKEFIELSRFELPNEVQGKSWAHPVVLDGRLYLRHAQYLYCYEVKTP